MDVHFNDTRSADAPAETLFGVITDYPHYPSFNSAIVKAEVVSQDNDGAEFVASRTTKVGKDVRGIDRYRHNGDFVIERTYGPDQPGRSTWTIHPVDAGHSTLTIDASMPMSRLKGMVMKPVLKRIFYGINFTPFIQEAERRAKSK